MSLEPGGRADKYGNEYENQQLAWILLDLVAEKASSVIVEPLGEYQDSVECIVERPDGHREFYQCKSSNGGHDYWSISDLKKHNVFERILIILNSDLSAQYHFLSPLSFRELDELCKRARTNESASDWKTYQLTNNEIRSTFVNCAIAFGLNSKDAHDIDRLHSLLSRCFFEQMPYTDTAVQHLENQINVYFYGNAQSVRSFLQNYANSNGRYGNKITAKEIADASSKAGFPLRSNLGIGTALQRINSLNHDYWTRCPGINSMLLHRQATDKAVQHIIEGRSVILHGRAGMGKSGCLQEIIDYLSANGILYLAIKLDKFIPKKSADDYGRDLGLPQSPVHSLSYLACENLCVLISDQLDALRWTSPYSSTALGVCKELISQVNEVNKQQNNKFSLVFASRTYDLEYDNNLRGLFDTEDAGMNGHRLTWEKVCVDSFTEDDVKSVLQDEFSYMPVRLKRIVQTPSYLYVWTKIRKENRTGITSVATLMEKWWEQIETDSKAVCISWESVCRCKDDIVRYMENSTSFSINSFLFSDRKQEIDYLASTGILNKDNRTISFVHQSFLDYFIFCNLLNGVYSGKSLAELIGGPEKQTPNVRYRLSAVLRALEETDITMFISQT